MATNMTDEDMTEEMHARSEMMMIASLLGSQQFDSKDFLKSEGLTRKKSSAVAESIIASLNEEKKEEKIFDEKEKKAFHRGELETFKKVMDEIDKVVSKRVQEGFQEINFTIGVLNCILVTFVFAAFPQHFWVLYLAESAYLMPHKIKKSFNAKPFNQIFYLFDFCWVMNFIGIAAFALIAGQLLSVDPAFRKQLFLANVGITCGPLLGATAALPFVAVLFHDKNTMTGLFIHLFPPMLTYTLLWHSEAIKEAWPNRFDLQYLDEISFLPEGRVFLLPGQGLGSVAGNAMMLYIIWLVPYLCWMLSIGLKLPLKRKGGPEPKYDTVFHSLMRGGTYVSFGSALWGRPKEVSMRQMEQNDLETRDFLVYMCVHIILANFSIFVLGYLCFTYQRAHAIFLALLTVIVVFRGAARYTYYSTVMYGKQLRKQFAALIVEAQKKNV